MYVEKLLEDMTLEEKIGQMFMLAFAGNRLDEARVLLEEHFVGACYIGNENVPTPEAAVQLTQALQSYAGRTRLKIPMLLGADQEGAWSVMTPASSPGPGNMALGATASPDDAYRMYKVIGQELTSVGLNAIFAPCADCNSNPINSIIGMRSFGEKPDLVGALTAAAVRGAHDGGIIATVKHFPGHGDTTIDTHRGLASVNRTQEELAVIDLHPFNEGIKAGVDMVMTSHIIFTALDPNNPATLSPFILQNVLRQQLGFEGVVVSDSMNMQAMKKNYAPHISAIAGLKAGVDVMMLAEEHYDHDAATYLQQQRELITAVKAAVESGELPIERVNDAVRRVLSLKAKYNLLAQSKDYEHIVGSADHRQIELDVARHAVAILRDDNHLLPVSRARSIALVNTTQRSSYAGLGATRGIGPNQTTAAFAYFSDAMKDKYPNHRLFSAEDVLAGELDLQPDELVIAVTENYPLPGMDFDQSSQVQVIQQLLEVAPDRLIVVALRDPYELRYLPDVRSYVCAFSFRPASAQAAAEILNGEFEPQGKSPVSVPDTEIVA